MDGWPHTEKDARKQTFNIVLFAVKNLNKMEKERITKEEFKERLENLIREYDWSYTDDWTFFSTDEKQHAKYYVDISINRTFRLK